VVDNDMRGAHALSREGENDEQGRWRTVLRWAGSGRKEKRREGDGPREDRPGRERETCPGKKDRVFFFSFIFKTALVFENKSKQSQPFF
jgi:hypothetical protein